MIYSRCPIKLATAGPYVTDDDVRYIVDCIKEAIVR